MSWHMVRLCLQLYEDVISSKYPSFVADVQHTAFVLPIFHLAQSEETGMLRLVALATRPRGRGRGRGRVRVRLRV